MEKEITQNYEVKFRSGLHHEYKDQRQIFNLRIIMAFLCRNVRWI